MPRPAASAGQYWLVSAPARGFAIFVLVLLASLPIAAQQKVDWQDLYPQSIRPVKRREWMPAEEKLLAAIKAGPKSGRGVIRRFMDRDDYYPEFYLRSEKRPG